MLVFALPLEGRAWLKSFQTGVRIVLPFTRIGTEWYNVPIMCQALEKSADTGIAPGGRGLTQGSDGLGGAHIHIRKKTIDCGRSVYTRE